MHSIRSKITALSLSCVLLCTAITAGISYWFFSRAQTQSSDKIMSLTCLEHTNRLNQELLGVEGSVNACAELVTSSLSAMDDITDDEAFALRMEELELEVGSIAQNTSGVCTYYLRVARKEGVEPDGFFYTRKDRRSELTKEPLTPISNYDPTDTEHVGWYYQPAEAGRAIWMAPYYNQNIDVYMVSYVAPLYVNGTFAGVVGMDVDLNVIIDAIRNIKPYETGAASLVSEDGVIYYHPDDLDGTSVVDNAPELASYVEQFPSLADGEPGESVTFVREGVERKLTCCSLRNGMILMLYANTGEINAPVNNLLRTAAVVGLVMSLLAIAVVVKVSARITKPLVQLTEVAKRIAEGDMNVELPPAGDDEVGVLTKSLDVTVESLRTYIEGMHAKAYRDALTMVKNKAAYDDAAKSLQERMDAEDFDFGLLMLDVNFLKVINDEYGHERGDDYLRTCCQLVCHVFEHSPVYRIGGDEFVVLLQRDDYQRREELLAELDQRMEASQQESDAWKRISLAKGLAVRGESDTSVEDVFRRADQAMYENKRKMKAER